jgi:hypothetical protein
MSKVKLTISFILAALYNRMSWSKTSHDRESLTYNQFMRIMMDDLEIIIDNGTCRQKWNDLIQCGYFIQSGKDAANVDMAKVRAKVVPLTSVVFS